MLKVFHNDKMATAVLTECEYDAILYYSKRLTDTMNSQIRGCDSFNIIFNSFNFGKHSINQDLRLPCKFQATVMINGDTQEDIIAAENAAKKRVLDGYHEEMRKAKVTLVDAMGAYVSEVMHRLVDLSCVLEPWNVEDDEDSTPRLFNGIPVPKHHNTATSDNDNEKRPVIPASKCLSMLPKDYNSVEVPSFNDLVKAWEDALDEDDDPIEGDRVSANSNFSSREPLTEKDEDDYTDDVEPTDPIPCKKPYEAPVIIPVDDDEEEIIPESNGEDIL